MLFKCQTFLRNNAKVLLRRGLRVLILFYFSRGCTGLSTLRLKTTSRVCLLGSDLKFILHKTNCLFFLGLFLVHRQKVFCRELWRIRMHHQQIISHLKINHLSTCKPATLEIEFPNRVGSMPAGGNSHCLKSVQIRSYF